MSEHSAIEWTDATWNPVRGCVKVSPGCAHCYAETFAERFRGVPGHPYEHGFDLRLVPEKLLEPLSWKKPRRVFVNSMSDLFQDGVPDSYIDQVFAVMALPTDEGRRAGTYKGYTHTFQVLTKRAKRMHDYMNTPGRKDSVARAAMALVKARGTWWGTPYSWPLPNVWLGVSVENQHFADERIPLLLQTPAAVRFISAEPLLGPVDLTNLAHVGRTIDSLYCFTDERDEPVFRGATLDWVIVGGESGSGARSFDVAWARSIVRQCHAVGVACFVKQLGAKWYDSERYVGVRGSCVVPVDSTFRWVKPTNKKGGDIAEFPADLRVRQFPEVRP